MDYRVLFYALCVVCVCVIANTYFNNKPPKY